jgi:hypothetical protein
MTFQQSCAKLAAAVVEKLSPHICTDTAKVIMDYVNLEKDIAEQINHIAITTLGIEPDASDVAIVHVMWNIRNIGLEKNADGLSEGRGRRRVHE